MPPQLVDLGTGVTVQKRNCELMRSNRSGLVDPACLVSKKTERRYMRDWDAVSARLERDALCLELGAAPGVVVEICRGQHSEWDDSTLEFIVFKMLGTKARPAVWRLRLPAEAPQLCGGVACMVRVCDAGLEPQQAGQPGHGAPPPYLA